jgi:hypothetical protein
MHGPVLAFLTGLFLIRVLGQALVVFFSVDWLPASEHWFSGLIPYPPLLGIQLILAAAMIKITADVWRGAGFFAEPQPSWTRLLIVSSAVYAAIMHSCLSDFYSSDSAVVRAFSSDRRPGAAPAA